MNTLLSRFLPWRGSVALLLFLEGKLKSLNCQVKCEALSCHSYTKTRKERLSAELAMMSLRWLTEINLILTTNRCE